MWLDERTKMGENSQKQRLGIHYYFDDDSHSMNAFIRNQMEKNYLDIITEIARILGAEVKIESQAREEGGVKENIIIILLAGNLLSYFAPSINDIVAYYATGGYAKDKLENRLKELQIERYEIENEVEKQKLQDLIIEKTNKLYESQKIRRSFSNFYKKAKQCEKLTQIGYKGSKDDEIIIKRDNFSDFILDTSSNIETDDNATIEIISPVLKEGKFKWRGIYKGEKIDFSMGDYGFKKSVIEKRHNFENGSTIISKLAIKNTFDEFGEKTKNTSYRVEKVYKIMKNDIIIKTNAGRKKDKKIAESNERSLFEFGDDNATE